MIPEIILFKMEIGDSPSKNKIQHTKTDVCDVKSTIEEHDRQRIHQSLLFSVKPLPANKINDIAKKKSLF